MFICDTPADELNFILQARKEGVLKNIDPTQYPENSCIGNQCIMCSDSDQMGDTMAHHGRIMKQITLRHGWLGLYGGALLIPKYSPLNQGEGRIILEHLFLGYLLNKGPTIPLFSHGACAMAKLYNLTVPDCFKLLGDAKIETRAFFATRKANMQRCIQVQADFHRLFSRAAKLVELELEVQLDRTELAAIYRAEKLLMLNNQSLSDAVALDEPTVVAQYQVDYGTFGGLKKRRSYFFDLHAFNNMAQRALARAHF